MTVAAQVSSAPAITTRDLTYRWPGADLAITYPDITLARGQHLFLQGPSGSGKSTLLSMLCGLASAQAGRLMVMGEDLRALSAGKRDQFRADYLGVIFQQFNLVPYLNTTANVTLPCRLSRRRRQRVAGSPEQEASSLLKALGLEAGDWQRPVTALSVGQQQRVAAARALIGAPSVVLADEPTSALDTDNRDRFLELLLGQARAQGTSVVLVSHDPGLANHFDASMSLGASS